MKQIAFNENLTELSRTNPVINEFISSHIYAWSCFSEYHCQKQKKVSPLHIYCDFLESRIVGLSISSMLQMEEKKILWLLREKSGNNVYSELDMWMLRQIKQRIYAIYSGNLQIDPESKN